MRENCCVGIIVGISARIITEMREKRYVLRGIFLSELPVFQELT
jgi:hypothetical protein